MLAAQSPCVLILGIEKNAIHLLISSSNLKGQRDPASHQGHHRPTHHFQSSKDLSKANLLQDLPPSIPCPRIMFSSELKPCCSGTYSQLLDSCPPGIFCSWYQELLVPQEMNDCLRVPVKVITPLPFQSPNCIL